MTDPDRIALPPDVHEIVCRWIVYFTLMSDDTQPAAHRPLALIRRLSMQVQPCVGPEELAQLTDYVAELLDGPAELPPLVASEAWTLHCWLDSYSGGWLV